VNAPTLSIVGIPIALEFASGDDLVAVFTPELSRITWPDGSTGVRNGDVVVMTSKIVSKAEGRVVPAEDRDEWIDRESVRTVATRETPRGTTRIVQTRHGLIMAAAGVDASNTETGTVVLLPLDPDSSARTFATGIQDSLGITIGVVISDTMGRPWRNGVTDVAIGAANLQVLDDHVGRVDAHGNTLEMTVIAIADEIAAAADLVKGKLAGAPVAVVRGMQAFVTAHAPGAAGLIRSADEDLFALGVREARASAAAHRRTIREFSNRPVPDSLVEAALTAAITAPAPHHSTPWRFLIQRQSPEREDLLRVMETQWRRDLESTPSVDPSSIEARIARGALLHSAPLVVWIFTDMEAAHTYPDSKRTNSERDMFLLSAGAAAQNAMVTLAAHGVGSAWIGSSVFCAEVVRTHLGLADTLVPAGALAVGYPKDAPTARTERALSEFLLP
jgi:coenzyme F420-0:L-glutamate ligase/coenzyme F420-1:gamma-L-glutamate ligase